jgi:hypothetical protein
MEIHKPKTLEDLPKFVATAVCRGTTSKDGYTSFELEGSFDRILESTFDKIIADAIPRWFWLLFGERGCLCPMLKSFEKEASTAILDLSGKRGTKSSRIGVGLSQSLLAGVQRLDGSRPKLELAKGAV